MAARLLAHRVKIDLRFAKLDAVISHFPRIADDLGDVQQSLRGNASDVQAGSAKRCVLLDDGHLLAKLCRPDGGDIAAGAAADDDEIISVAHRVRPLHVQEEAARVFKAFFHPDQAGDGF